jgi:hypothetical protein
VATGLDLGKPLVPASGRLVEQIHATLAAASDRLKGWIATIRPRWQTAASGLGASRMNARRAKGAAAKRTTAETAAQAEKAFSGDPDLVAYDTLVREYTERVLDEWGAYGIQTIPPDLVQSFLRVGAAAGARWGGEYESSKDAMHLELSARRLISRDGPRVEGITDLGPGQPASTPERNR